MMSTAPSDTYLWKKRYALEFHRGLRRTTGPERAQKHVRELMDSYGVGVLAIADAAGTAPDVISELSHGICTGMLVSTETAILSVRLEQIMGRPNPQGLVPSVGTRRRLQALLTMGWRHKDLSPLLGYQSGRTLYQTGRITQRKHEATKRVYDQLWNKRGPADARAMRVIAKAGYAPPLAWDDDSIDDPNAQPDLGARVYAQGRCPEGVIHQSDATVEDVEFLINEGLNWDAVTERLAVNPDSLERLLVRKNRGDLTTRAKTMAGRRVYARAS